MVSHDNHSCNGLHGQSGTGRRRRQRVADNEGKRSASLVQTTDKHAEILLQPYLQAGTYRIILSVKRGTRTTRQQRLLVLRKTKVGVRRT